MCCFSKVEPPGFFARLFARGAARLDVSATKIFARLDPATSSQWLAYSLALATPSDVAMVLPVPVARVADDALQFVDLSACAELFDDLDRLFPAPVELPFALDIPRAASSQAVPLVVHEVGSFEASFVPSLADMGRLDPRFRIPELVWRRRPEYARYGFAVFKLKQGKTRRKIHPMAMRFETAEPDALFFPTVHVHDGTMHDRARFDHALYYQVGDGDAPVPRGPDGAPVVALEASYPMERHVSVDRARGVVAAGGRAFKLDLRGALANADVRVALNSAAAAPRSATARAR